MREADPELVCWLGQSSRQSLGAGKPNGTYSGSGRDSPRPAPTSKIPSTNRPVIRDLGVFLAELLGLTPDLFDAGQAISESVSLYVAEGR